MDFINAIFCLDILHSYARCYSWVKLGELYEGLLFILFFTTTYNSVVILNTVTKLYWSEQYGIGISSVQFSSLQSFSHVRLFVTPWITACQASLSITNSRSSLRLTSIKSVTPSSHLILCRLLLLLPPILPSIRVFSNESTLRVRCHKNRQTSGAEWSPEISFYISG